MLQKPSLRVRRTANCIHSQISSKRSAFIVQQRRSRDLLDYSVAHMFA